MPKKLSNKLIIYYILVTVILVTVIYTLLGGFLKTIHLDIIKSGMEKYDGLIYSGLKDRKIRVTPSAELTRAVSRYSGMMQLRITIISMDGTVIADSDVKDFENLENHYYRKEIQDAFDSGYGFSTRYSNTLKTDMLYYALYRDGFIIRLAKPLYEVDKSLESLRSLVLKVSILVLLATIIIITIISFRITKPFNETLEFAADFSNGNYERRILNYSNDEIGLLQKALNRMADTIVNTINSHILEHRKLEATLDSISDGIAMIDSEKQIIIFNNSFLSILDINSEEINEKQYFEIIRNSTLNSHLEKAVYTGKRETFEIELNYDRTYETLITPIQGNRTIQGLLIVLHDISEKRKIERVKSDLVSNVSHELKTPIAIVRGYLETIRENYDDKTMTSTFIERAIENLDRQNALIQDIIKLSMIESVKEFEMEEINIRLIIERCVDLLALKISKKEIALTTSLDLHNDHIVTGNPFLVEEIFFNILDNGINYNRQKGSLSIESSVSGKSLIIKIADTGIGIPAEFRERIFERFYRVDRSRSRATGGTGLGLSIVKHAAMVLGWNITVDSGNGGTTFIITINS